MCGLLDVFQYFLHEGLGLREVDDLNQGEFFKGVVGPSLLTMIWLKLGMG